jgi:dihydrofolate synthase / folylpolyglutamate synthase
VRAVLARLGLDRPAPQVLTIGGTNGKGSVVACLEAILGASGYDVGCFTSPHLIRYNERIRIGGRPVEDAVLLDAFDRIDQARG